MMTLNDEVLNKNCWKTIDVHNSHLYAPHNVKLRLNTFYQIHLFWHFNVKSGRLLDVSGHVVATIIHTLIFCINCLKKSLGNIPS